MRLFPRSRRPQRPPQPRRAERFLAAGADQSRTFGHGYVGTEHVLLALVEDADTAAAQTLARLGFTREIVRRDIEQVLGTGIAPRRSAIDPDALATLGIDLDEVTRRIEETFGPGALANVRRRVDPAGATCRCIAPRLKQALELAAAEAGDGPVRSDHVLVSLAAVEDCVAARILDARGVSPAALRDALAT